MNATEGDELGRDDLFEIPNGFGKRLYVTREKELRIDQLISYRSQARLVTSPHVQSFCESFQEYEEDYTMRMILVVENVASTGK